MPISLAAFAASIDHFRFLRMRSADIHTVAQLLGDKDLRMAADAAKKLDEVFAEQPVVAAA